MGARFEPTQLFSPHRSYVQMLPSGPTATPEVDPHFLPSGNCAQLRTVLYGLGKSLRGSAPVWGRALTPDTAIIATAAAAIVNLSRFPRGMLLLHRCT